MLWTEKDVEWLKDHHKTMSLSALAKRLNRSIKAIRHKIKWLELPRKKKNHYWSQAEDERLGELYLQKLSLDGISEAMGRSVVSIRLRANRILKAFRSDRHLRERFSSDDFYVALKGAIRRGSAKARCCLCDYDKYIELHHVDGNRDNNFESNISSLCPTHHVEVTRGEHKDRLLYCVWWRVYSDGTCSESYSNERIRKELGVFE